MRPRILTTLLCLALAGCATPGRLSEREAAAEARGYERFRDLFEAIVAYNE